MTWTFWKKWSTATMVSNSPNQLSGTSSTSFMSSRRVLGSKYLTQSYPTYPMAPPVKGGSRSEGMSATRLFANSWSRRGRGSASRPCLEPDSRILRGSVPMKLYLAIVSVVAADSNRKEYFDSDLPRSFRYIADGVRNSDEMEAQSGMRDGGLSSFLDDSTRLATCSSDGCTVVYNTISFHSAVLPLLQSIVHWRPWSTI